VFGFGNLDRMSFGRSRKRARMVRKKKLQRRERKRMVWTVESESLRMELPSINREENGAGFVNWI